MWNLSRIPKRISSTHSETFSIFGLKTSDVYEQTEVWCVCFTKKEIAEILIFTDSNWSHRPAQTGEYILICPCRLWGWRLDCRGRRLYHHRIQIQWAEEGDGNLAVSSPGKLFWRRMFSPTRTSMWVLISSWDFLRTTCPVRRDGLQSVDMIILLRFTKL